MTAAVLYAATFAIAWPLYEYFVDWPRFQRSLKQDAGRARIREYRSTMVRQWLLAGAGAVLWLRAGRQWVELGVHAPDGWRAWAAVAGVAALSALYAQQAATLARSQSARRRVRQSLTALEPLLPHTATEFTWLLGVSFTAGVCEEFLYRGYFVAAFAPYLGWWPACLLAVPLFGLLHAYQGRKGVVRTGVVGLVMTLVVALTRSLFPAMVLHVIVDVGGGLVTWIALREATPEIDE
jgi:hypothetical protein